MTQYRTALEYVNNTGGNGTVASLIDGFEPIGEQLWNEIKSRGHAFENDGGNLELTGAGIAFLASGEGQ